MLLKASHENTEAKVYFCPRLLLGFSVKCVGKIELISCMLLLSVEIVTCDFCMWLTATCTVRESAEMKMICGNEFKLCLHI